LLISDFGLRIDGQTHSGARKLKEYTDTLLAAFPPVTMPPQSKISYRPNPADWAQSAMIEPLTERELEILRLMGEGCSNQEIAGRLVITLHTVKKHSSNLFAKLEVSSRTQAVARARQLRLL
jgi:LuxR family maltose regulon positive regulatory protein